MFKRSLYALLLALGIFVSGIGGGRASAAQVLRQGSSSGDVWDLQYRLHAIGYYPQSMDGLYGPNTASAVSRFQRDYGLSIDGVVGGATWNVLNKVTLDQSEMDILAHVIYSEARGETYKGKVAVGAVVMNRIQSDKFPNTIRGVVFQPGAFSAVDDGQFWMKPDASAYSAAYDAVRGWDPTYGSIYYFNPQTATSKWIWSRPQTVTIGHHIFTK
jgi:N-acetylmuramoyl-L-alanine amidase